MKATPDDEVDFFVRLAGMCERYHCLPGPGGLLQQDAYIMMGVRLASEALAERRKREEDKQTAQMEANMPRKR